MTNISNRILLGLFAISAIGSLTQVHVAANSATQEAGDVARGKAIVEGKGNCLSCHRVADQGSYMGPDLSAIGDSRKPAEITKALLDPNPEVASQNHLYKAVTKDGKSFTGRLLNQDVYIVQMLTTESKLVTLKRSDLREADFTTTPPMPSYRDKLTVAEQSDLLAYLTSLKGVVKQ